MPTKKAQTDLQEISLRRWRVVEVEFKNGGRSRHIWGHDAKNGLGRATSQIIRFDLEAMTATTRSGRNYKLVGLPGNSRLGKDAWNKWCSDNAVVTELDVTNEYLNVDHLSTAGFARVNRSVN